MFSRRVRRNDAPPFPILCALSVCALDESNTSIYIFFPTQNYMTLPTQLYVLTNSYTCGPHSKHIFTDSTICYSQAISICQTISTGFSTIYSPFINTLFTGTACLFSYLPYIFLKSPFGAFPIFFYICRANR